MNSQTGFTLYELLITVLVIGVILTLGVPNMQEFTRNSRITATSSDLHASFLLARSEAVRARAPVTICGLDLTALAADQPACGGSFQNGWIVFVDTVGNGNIVREAGDTVLRTFPAVDAGLVRISTNAGANYFGFAGTGLGRGNVMGAGTALVSAVVCDDRGNTQAAGVDSTARAVVATPTGRATVLRGHAQVAAQITNNSLTCS